MNNSYRIFSTLSRCTDVSRIRCADKGSRVWRDISESHTITLA